MMANRPKKRKELDSEDDLGLSPGKKLKTEDTVNVSRTGRQRKKSAKVLEMEAEAEELEQMLRARVDTDDSNRSRPPIFKGPRPKKVAPKVEVDTEEEDLHDSDSDFSETPHQPVLNEAVSKSGRVRKKSAKLLEMVEVEQLDRKIFRSSDIPKSIRIAPLQPPPTAHSMKKNKSPLAATGGSTTPSTSAPPGSPPATPGGSTIKLLLSSPSKKSTSSGSPPEPILSTLGATLGTPTKKSPLPLPQTPPAPVLQQPSGSPQPSKEPFKVKFLADSPDVVLSPKPPKKKAKKESVAKPLVVATEEASPLKDMLPKLKMMLSPKEKSPGDAAAIMADQPLLSKMMGEVGQALIGPPPPSSAEAKNLKKRAKKEAKEAAQFHGEKKKKIKAKDSEPTTGIGAIQTVSSALAQHLMVQQVMPVLPSINEGSIDEDSDNQLMIDITKEPKKKKNTKDKEKKKIKLIKTAKGTKKHTILEVPVPNQGFGILDDNLKQEITDDSAGPSYANTHEMANKVKTSQEKKANKDKKRKGKGKEGPEKAKKRRAPTAYMLWCNSHRAKLVAESPGIDFATISRRLGELWQGQSDKEKMAWKRKAKKLAAKGSTLISTGKGASKMSHSSSAREQTKGSGKGAASSGAAKGGSAAEVAAAQNRSGQESPGSPAKASMCTGALDIAAHLKLLGESLSIIGARLQEHHGQIAVQGTLPVLLDSLLCAIGPLTCLTSHVSELDGASIATHTKTLDNIAYIMPGIG